MGDQLSETVSMAIVIIIVINISISKGISVIWG